MFKFVKSLLSGESLQDGEVSKDADEQEDGSGAAVLDSRLEVTLKEVKDCLKVVLKSEVGEMNLVDAVVKLHELGFPYALSCLALELPKIVAGRKLMREMNLNPKLPEYYLTRFLDKKKYRIPFKNCVVFKILSKHYESQTDAGLSGMMSLEMLALNQQLHQFGENPSPEQIESIELGPVLISGGPIKVRMTSE